MAPRIIRPHDGKMIDLGACGVRFMVWGEESGGGFSLVEHPIPPRHLAAPLHRHSREDEYSFVLEGRLGASLGEQVVYADPGDLVFKPRDQWHTFWNAGDSLCRILEIVPPARIGEPGTALKPTRQGPRESGSSSTLCFPFPTRGGEDDTRAASPLTVT